MGSSPRMRGALSFSSLSPSPKRIIPADAGSTVSTGSSPSLLQDHPRGCGEHLLRRQLRGRQKGSSPRMRGALVQQALSTDKGGIIPADAGSTRSPSASCSSARDHPRGCGEHHAGGGRGRRAAGSSPRMRGALSHLRGPAQRARIIPADAGSTNSNLPPCT